ncbi:MAG: hypothetical protein JRE23_12770 [Deltaproteobacteria bacterium]|nr:hypothetical protein [Deltaproteobacteria bacterium]
MKAYLVRVGIDSTKPKEKSQDTGQFNSPVNMQTGEFAYIPIKETAEMIPEYRRTFHNFIKPCEFIGKELPSRLWNEPAHVDPDFSTLTYGDIDGKNPETGKYNRRGKPLRNLREGDILAFYAGLEPIQDNSFYGRIVDALIGIYVVQESITAFEFTQRGLADQNAHTRRHFNDTDIIVMAKRDKQGKILSGRLDKCLVIGNYRDGAHRVFETLLTEWGGLYVHNGWIQRSVVLPEFKDPEKFFDWFQRKIVEKESA